MIPNSCLLSKLKTFKSVRLFTYSVNRCGHAGGPSVSLGDRRSKTYRAHECRDTHAHHNNLHTKASHLQGWSLLPARHTAHTALLLQSLSANAVGFSQVGICNSMKFINCQCNTSTLYCLLGQYRLCLLSFF